MAQGPVELWVGELLLQQQASLHSVIKTSDLEINDEDFDLLSFLDKFQAQVRSSVAVRENVDSCHASGVLYLKVNTRLVQGIIMIDFSHCLSLIP